MVRILGPLLAGLIVGLVVGAGGFWLFGEGASGPSLAAPVASRFASLHETKSASASEAPLPAPVSAERAVAREESGAPLPRQVSESVTALAKDSGDLGYLASPVTGGGVRVDRLTQLYLQAKRDGARDPVVTTRDLPAMWKRVALAAACLAVGIVASAL